MQRSCVLGVIDEKVEEPEFPTKSVSGIVHDMPLPEETLQLFEWLKSYYPAPLGILLSLLLPTATINKQAEITLKTSAKTDADIPLPDLKSEQFDAVKKIANSPHSTLLLHGDTGTGKTRVYLELIRKTIAGVKSAIVLTPEIGLTPQLFNTLEESFSNKIVVIHSHLTPAQRRNAWLAILGTKSPLVVVGPRSALFSPLRNLGLVVIDEFHDQAYKQEQSPYYQTSRVAAKLASLHGAKLVMGSATPSVSDYYAIKAKRLPIIRMRELAVNTTSGEVDIEIVDLKKRDNFSRSHWLSDSLIKEIDANLKKKEQSLVFLNRRGSARLVLCKECGWQAICKRCDLSLTYHDDRHSFICHTCGLIEKTPSNCPECKSTDIIFKSAGTKMIVNELEKLFPNALIMRFDSDSNKKQRLEQNYGDVFSGKVDILVGTQLLTKGLDLPKLSLVGIIAADTSLYFPDYTAEERTFQLISQVIGRVNRGHKQGKVIVQTYYPDASTITAALSKDYENFYENQLVERKTYLFPPFVYLLKLTCSRKSQKSAKAASSKLVDNLRSIKLPVEVIGPSPAFYEKLNNNYRWQIIVKSKHRQHLTKIIAKLPSKWSYDIDPSHLL
jgi:primosomal protein N' (replication factor Y)